MQSHLPCLNGGHTIQYQTEFTAKLKKKIKTTNI